uniref:Uncharacterized protein n=1 Tax=Leersia perrieri TaxID=77586 RepID=A0A0D9X4V0_9ORYZ
MASDRRQCCSPPALPAPSLGKSRSGEKSKTDHVVVVDELISKQQIGAGSDALLSREYDNVQKEAAADVAGDGGGEKMKRAPLLAQGGRKAELLGWGEPMPGGGPHWN